MFGSKILSEMVGFLIRAVWNNSCFAGTSISSSKTTAKGSVTLESNTDKGLVDKSGNVNTILERSTLTLLLISQSRQRIISDIMSLAT
jgi:hypothetical protein